MNNYSNNSGKIDLLQSVRKTLEAFNMIQPNDAVLAGVSGGPDSVALLQVLHSLAAEVPFTLAAAHVNHCLRGKDSDADAKFVLTLCNDMKIPCYTAEKNVFKYKEEHKLSLEEAARRVRYEFYYQTAKQNGFSKIALGHHRDDNAELILMHLFRGSGPLGLTGIPPVRNLKENAIKIIRPFIQVSKSQLIDFLNKTKTPYVNDASNTDTSILRNKVRNNLIPLLQTEYNPKIVETLNRLSEIIRCDEEWIEDIIESLFEKQVIHREAHRLSFPLSGFIQLPAAARRRIIRKAIIDIQGNIRKMNRNHIDRIIGFAEKGPACGSLDFPNRIRVCREENQLVIFQEKKPLRDIRPSGDRIRQDPFTYTIPAPLSTPKPDDHSIFINEINATLVVAKSKMPDLEEMEPDGKRHMAFFDYDKLYFPLTLRNILPGDRFTPLGASGSKKVNKYFIDHKIPQAERSNTPVLLSNEKIIWLVGHRIDDAVKINEATQNVLKAELLLA